MDFSLRQVRAFLAVVDRASFTQAAADVHVTQPALTAQIKLMEAQMGGALFRRSAKGAVPTPLGRAVEPHARAMMAEHARLAALARHGGGTTVEVTLGMIPTIAPYLIPGALGGLREAAPGLTLQLRELTSAELLLAVGRGEVDVGVLATPYDLPGELAVRPLFDDPFLVAGAGDEVARLGSVASTDPARLLLLDEGHCLADQTLALCGRVRAAARTDVSAASLATVCRLAAAGFGVTLLPALAAPVEVRAPLVAKGMREAGAKRQVVAVCHPGQADAPWLALVEAALIAAGKAAVAEGLALAS